MSNFSNEAMGVLEGSIRAVLDDIRENGELNDELLDVLSTLFPHTLLISALDIVDRSFVTRLVSQSKRIAYQVQGKKESYLCLSSYCSCPSFMYTVINRSDSLYCKHMLGTLLGDALNKVQEKEVSDEELVNLLEP